MDIQAIDWPSFYDVVVAIAAIIAAAWAVAKWWRRDEHFPRVSIDVDLKFIGKDDQSNLVEVVTLLENRGLVPIKIRRLRFSIYGIPDGVPFATGDSAILHQVNFPCRILQSDHFPAEWVYTFANPNVRNEYTYAAMIPLRYKYLRVNSRFDYPHRLFWKRWAGVAGDPHTAAKIMKVPE